MREAFGIVDHNDGLSTDDEQNNLETTKFNSTRGTVSVYSVVHIGRNLSVRDCTCLQFQGSVLQWISRVLTVSAQITASNLLFTSWTFNCMRPMALLINPDSGANYCAVHPRGCFFIFYKGWILCSQWRFLCSLVLSAWLYANSTAFVFWLRSYNWVIMYFISESRSSCFSVVKVMNCHLVNPGSYPAVISMSRGWCREGHLIEIPVVLQTSPT